MYNSELFLMSVKPMWAEKAQVIMKRKRIFQKDVAHDLKVTVGTVNHWFSGRRSIALTDLIELAKSIGTTASFLVQDTESELSLDGSSKYITEALMLICRARDDLNAKEVKDLFLILEKIGIENIVDVAVRLKSAEIKQENNAATLLNILDYAKKIG